MKMIERNFDPTVYEDPVKILEREFLARKKKNPAYSLRSFARDLNFSASQLSRVFNRQRSITPSQAGRIASALHFSKRDTAFFLKTTVLNAPATAKIAKGVRIKAEQDAKRDASRTVVMTDLSVERFKAISQWYHLPILELSYLDSFSSDERWIAKQLGISTIEARDAVNRLLNLGLFEECAIKGLKKTMNRLFVNSKSEPEVRSYERSMIEKTIPILEQGPSANSAVTLINSITFPVAVEGLPEVRDAILQFQRRILKLIKNDSYDEVYQMNCQLFPLTKNTGVKK